MAKARLLSLLVLIGFVVDAPAQGVSVVPGQNVAVNLPANNFTTSYFVDVGPEAHQLIVSFESPPGPDLVLMLRYGNGFPSGAPGQPPLFLEQLEYAHYASVGDASSERIAISRSNRVPVQAGRWHMLLINFSNQPVNATLRAEVINQPPGAPPIELVYDEPSCPTGSSDHWFDPGPRQDSPSNPGQTIGEQRRIAMERAAELVANELRSAVPIRIAACWSDLGTGTSITLAQAGPRRAITTGPLREDLGFYQLVARYLPENHIWFTGPVAMRLAGSRGCASDLRIPCNEAEIGITFNFQVDTDQALGNNRWQYVLTPQEFTGTFGPSFISVAMHEIAHGLGFLGLVNANPESSRPVGDKFNGFGDAYTRNMVIQQQDGSFLRYLEVSNAERAAALTSQTRLQWDEPEAVNSIFNTLRPNNVRIFAPPALQPGSTQSHIDQSAYGNELMRPSSTQFTQQTLGLARFMLNAVGWSPAERSDAGFAEVPSSLLFDPRRSGHGIDLRRVIDNVYFLLFYTFDSQGLPEWYAAVGEVVDGAFLPAENADGNSLIRLNYIPGETPPQQPDPSFSGFIRLDFNEARNHTACNDGFAGRDPDNALAVMQFAINSGVQTWCMESLLPDAILPDPASDLGGTWYAGEEDTGWGFSVGQFLTTEGNGLFVALYYPDAEGNPRWAVAQTGNFQPGTTEPLFQFDGYCRSCERPEGNLPATQVGTIALSLVEASTVPVAGNSVQLTVTYQGPEGGTFTRTVPLQSLSAPGG